MLQKSKNGASAASLSKREALIAEREASLTKREASLKRKEASLKKREACLSGSSDIGLIDKSKLTKKQLEIEEKIEKIKRETGRRVVLMDEDGNEVSLADLLLNSPLSGLNLDVRRH